MLWLNHLENMNYLRDSVRLRAYGNKNPLVEYKKEGFEMFTDLLKTMEASIAKTMLQVRLTPAKQQQETYVPQKNKEKVGRNDPCPCGSGKKYKKCCYPKYS